jgi:DNA mismatch endonuclease (patch repair protein)
MADIWDSATRSRVMAKIRGKHTKPELLVRRYLFAHGFRFRLHVKSLPGCPDIVLPAYRTVIQVHGCFWHGHAGCREFRIPQTRPDFWEAKITRNQARDQAQAQLLQSLGWHLIVVWECELKGSAARARLANLLRELTDQLWEFRALRAR